MSSVLYARELAVRYFKKYEIIFVYAFKFLVGLYLISGINTIGGFADQFEPLFSTAVSIPFSLLLALLFTVAPPVLSNTIIAALLIIQISGSMVPAVFIGIILVLILVLYCRISPERCFIILAVLIAYRFNLVYAVVIFSGLYLGLSSIAPIAIAVFINNFIPFFSELVKTIKTPAEIDFVALPAMFLDGYKLIFEALTSNFNWVFTAFVFAIVVVAVYAISRLFTDYCAEIAIAVGAFVNIIGFICGSVVLELDTGIFMIILFSLLSAILVEVCHFFDIVLDYDKIERVQFQDDENYYYVKIVPKLKFLPDEPETVNSKHSETRRTAKSGPSKKTKAKQKIDFREILGLNKPKSLVEDDDENESEVDLDEIPAGKRK